MANNVIYSGTTQTSNSNGGGGISPAYSEFNDKHNILYTEMPLTSLGTSFTQGYVSAVYVNNKNTFYIAYYNQVNLATYNLATGQWGRTAATPFTITVYTRIAYDDNDTIYILKGGTGSTDDFFKYTISTNSWTQLANVGINHNEAPLCYANGKVYTSNVYSSNAGALKIYDISANTWSNSTALGSSTWGYGDIVRIDDDRLMCFGASYDGTTYTHNRTYQYNTAANSWTSRANGAAVQYKSAVLIDSDRILVTTSNANTFIYTISTNAYATGPSLATYFLGESKGNLVNGYVYYFGSMPSGSSHIIVYDVANNTWNVDSFGVLLPEPTYQPAVIKKDNDLYIFGSTGATEKSGYKFSLTNRTFSNLKPSIARTSATNFCLHNNYIYCMGAYSGDPTAQRYSIANNTWETVATLPYNFISTGHVKINNFLYLFGAVNSAQACGRFNLDTYAWTELTPAPYGVNQSTAVEANGKIYVYGGASHRMLCYTINDNKWEIVGNLAFESFTEAINLCSIFYNGEIYIFGIAGGQVGYEETGGIGKILNAMDTNDKKTGCIIYNLTTRRFRNSNMTLFPYSNNQARIIELNTKRITFYQYLNNVITDWELQE